MITVEFLGPIGKEALNLDISSLSELKTTLNGDPELKQWLEKCAVAVNDKMVYDLNFALKDGDRVSILPPVCGG